MDFRLYIWPRYVLQWDGHEIKLTPLEGAVLSQLVLGKPTSYADITDGLYSHREDGGPLDPDNVIAVTICRIRRKLRTTPFQIKRVSDKHARLITNTLDGIASEILDE